MSAAWLPGPLRVRNSISQKISRVPAVDIREYAGCRWFDSDYSDNKKPREPDGCGVLGLRRINWVVLAATMAAVAIAPTP